MALAAGDRIDHYEIARHIGAGGMGEVWLATDLTLGRPVALKLLPPHLTTDPARIARFQQEARAASALNHPNVCVIHALGKTEAGQHFIAMEHVEGQTLRQRLAGRRLTPRELLDIGAQMASALSAAHAAGVVHRDLKPENVMLRPDGFVKVLDFGLAKLVQPGSDPALDTRTVVHTDAGTAVGTVSYMSPEQARAQEVDARSDVWALGAVLYEMSAGQPPFVGTSVSDVLAGILEREPDPLTRFDRDVPHELQRIVGKALRKNPGQRYQVMKDLQLDLEALRDEIAISSAVRVPAAVPPPMAGRQRWIPAAALVAIVAAVVVVGVWWMRRTPPPPPAATRVRVERPLTRVTFDPGLQIDAAFSPDGRSIAYSSDRAGNFDIWLQPLDGGTGTARQITTSPASDTQPSWSPDGRSVVFRSERDGGGLFVASVDGGAERQISSFGLYPLWLKSTTEIFFRAGLAEYPTNVYVVSPDGGHAPEELVRDFVRGGAWNWAAPHPDGRVSVIGLHPDRRFGFYTVSRDSRHVTVSKIPEDFPLQFTETDTRLLRFQWNPSGDALFVEAILNEVRNVWKIRVEPRTLEWIDAERLTVGSGPDKAASLSGDGSRIVYTALQETIRLWSLPFDATSGRTTGKGAPITPEGRRVETFVLSPDGSFVAYSARAAGSQRTEMLLFDINGGKTEVFALNASPGAWAPDSRTLAYSLSRPDVPPPGEWALAVRQVGGAERIVRRWNTQSVFLPSGWTIDGRFILGSYLSPLYTGQPKLALWPNAPAEDGSERILVSDPESRPWQASFSPNGRWLTFVIEPTKTRVNARVVVTPAAGAPPAQWTHVVGVDEWVDKPRWAPDGRALYFLSNGGSSFFNLWGIRFDADRGMPVGEPFPITKFDSPGLIIAPNISSTELGIAQKRAVVTLTTLAGSIWMLGNVER